MRLRAHGSALALAIALCWASPARAQDDPRARALELFRQSAESYREGRFEEAAALLREARTLHSEPLLSYNLARALEGMGDLEGAVSAYREYLEEAPDAADAPAVRSRLEGLERHLAEVRAIEEDRARLERSEGERDRAPPTPPPAPRGPDALPWVFAGIGAAVMVAGAVPGALAIARRDDANRAPNHAAAVAALSDADGLATATNVLFVAGGVLLLGGVIWGSVDLVSSSGSQSSASLQIGPASLALTGTF